MKNLLITIGLITGMGISAFTQEKTFKESEGDKYASYYAYDKAIISYCQADPLSTDGQRKLAISYGNLGQNTESEEVLKTLLGKNEEIVPEDYYNYAMILKTNGKYPESDIWMEKFLELKPSDLRAIDYKANKEELRNLLSINDKYKIQHLDINTEALDFGTSYYKDKIVFSSTRTSSKMFSRKFKWTRKPFWDMYVSEVNSNQLETPEIFDEGLNSKMHDGPASFINEGTFMAFTKNNQNTSRKNRTAELQIYFSYFIDGKWDKPIEFSLNNKGYSVGHPCLSSDGQTMYFTSDMPGGFGGADLYRIKGNAEGIWGEPENLGYKINTEGDEMFPYLEENNQILYFASDGHFGLGELDIFSCAITESEFGQVYNAGSPLNTQFNDYAFIINNTLSRGYLSSDREGGSGGDDIYSMEYSEPNVRFSVYSPENIPVDRRVRETFPVRNYIFFEPGSTEIPARYVLLDKDQVKDFKEDQLEVFAPKELSGRSKRQLIVYYNVINILGDRMQKNPETTIKLVGSSEKGTEEAKVIAQSVKTYLVNVFAIDASRITTEGRLKPMIPSKQIGGILELDLLREDDSRVSIESSSPALLMEFQSGPNAPLKPVEIVALHEAPIDSYVSFNVDGADEVFKSWSLEIRDEKDIVQKFGPYTEETVAIPGKSILGNRSSGDYTATMVGTTKTGMTLKEEAALHMVLWTPSENEQGMRFSIIFEFIDSDAITMYEKYLNEIVTPKIPKNGTVIIHGHTDIIGDKAFNQKLSIARANEVKDILEKALTKAGRKDVKFETHGFGEDLALAPFGNVLPEERFYNRTVIIDLIPEKK